MVGRGDGIGVNHVVRLASPRDAVTVADRMRLEACRGVMLPLKPPCQADPPCEEHPVASGDLKA